MAATAKTTARSSSGLSYPDRFYAAASYVGFGGSPDAPARGDISRFQNDVALLLYGLYKQATVGPCTAAKPSAWNPVEHSKWTSWNGLGNMASMEAMRLFVKILEEEDPAWYSQVPELIKEPVIDAEMHKTKVEPVLESVVPSGDSLPPSKTISAENEVLLETQDKDIVMEGLGTVGIYDKWIAPSQSGQRPRPRYAHGAAVLEDKMYIFGGNHNGRYLNDLQVLDLKNLTWSRLEAKVHVEPSESSTALPVAPCAGHTLISWNNKVLCVAGHTKDPSETLSVKEFDPQTGLWSNLKIYGKPPISRGGQSVTLVGNTLVIFGGEDAKRSLLNDLDILDLETMTWDDLDTIGTPPSPRSDHVAACHADRYLLVFGGGSHATCFNDLHVLDLQTMEWSRPKQQGVTPGPRAGHAGVTIGDNWFITGGGNNKDGVSETLMLNMSTLFWSVVTTVQERAPIASEGLSLVTTTYNAEDFLVSFGGYNGRYSNEVYVLKPSYKSEIESRNIDGFVSDSVAPAANASRDVEPEIEATEDKRIKEIAMDNGDLDYVERSERVLATLKAEKEELEAKVNKEEMQNLQLKQELAEAESRNADITKELQSVRSQLASEQSRCFKLEVDLAELRQKQQSVETLQKEFELLQKQKAASEQAALSAKQRQGSGVWGWLAGSPTETE